MQSNVFRPAPVYRDEHSVVTIQPLVDQYVIIGYTLRWYEPRQIAESLARNCARMLMMRNAGVVSSQLCIPGRFQGSSLPELNVLRFVSYPGRVINCEYCSSP